MIGFYFYFRNRLSSSSSFSVRSNMTSSSGSSGDNAAVKRQMSDSRQNNRPRHMPAYSNEHNNTVCRAILLYNNLLNSCLFIICYIS